MLTGVWEKQKPLRLASNMMGTKKIWFLDIKPQNKKMQMKKVKYSYLLIGIFFSMVMLSCKPSFISKWTKEEAPEYFTAKFETTKGSFEIESRRSWSPAAVDRLYQLLKHGFYKDIAIYRVMPDYIAQFGIHNDSTVSSIFRKVKIIDEPVLKTNSKGTISFARGGPETRGTNLFINLKDNSPRLDTLTYLNVAGFPGIAQVTSGFDVVASFYDGYGAELNDKQDSIATYGNKYLQENYPKLDYIQKAYLTGESKNEI